MSLVVPLSQSKLLPALTYVPPPSDFTRCFLCPASPVLPSLPSAPLLRPPDPYLPSALMCVSLFALPLTSLRAYTPERARKSQFLVLRTLPEKIIAITLRKCSQVKTILRAGPAHFVKRILSKQTI